MTCEAGLSLHLDRGTGVLRITDDKALSLRIRGMLAAGTMTRLAHGNMRIGAISDVQAQRVQRMGEVTGFELMAGNAGFLADRLGIRREGIVGDMRCGKARCWWRYMRERRETIS